MSMQLGAARLIDDAFALMGRAGSQLQAGNATTASHLLGTASRTIGRAQEAAHPAFGFGHGAQTIMQAARARADEARTLIAGGSDAGRPSDLVASARFALDILRPG